MNQIVEKCKRVLEKHYGRRLAGVILYGSVARNESSPWSDIDLLVLLKQPFDYFEELSKIVDLLDSIQMASEQLISAKPAANDEFEGGVLQLYRNVKREGIRL